MKNRTSFKWLSLGLVLLLVVLTGCQAVNGLELNKVFQNGATVKSSQGASSFALELFRNPDATPSEEEQRMLDLFSQVKLNLTEVKQQDATHLSAKGSFEYAKGQIPFQMTVNEQEYTFLIEGAKKPIVLHNSPAGMEQMQDTMSKEMQEQIKQAYSKAADLSPSLISYIMGNAPNPANISVTDAQETIHNEGLRMRKIHAEIKGSELLGLFKGFVTNLVADEQGMKDMLGQIYDAFAPIMKQAMLENSQASDPSGENMVMPYLNNKTLAVEFAFTFIQSSLKKMLADFDSNLEKAKSEEGFNQVMSDQLSLKMDIYADSSLMPRKSNLEVSFHLPDSSTDAVKGFKLTVTGESWDLNQAVKADAIDKSAGVLELTDLSKPGKVLSGVDPKSQLYTLLKNDLQITKKNIQLIVDNNDSFDSSTKPYNSNGTIMVPARFVTEQLDADVAWDQATQQVTITDWVSGSVIKLNIGSKQASVNGMIKPLETEVELTNGSTFVPVRFIAESMGATVSWDQELQMVTIKRD